MPSLPVLVGGSAYHPEWRAYIKWVYGEEVPRDWGSPLDGLVSPMMRPPVLERQFPENRAWVNERPFIPEQAFAAFGFFVSRASIPLERLTSAGRWEVLRVRAWVRVFLNMDSLPVKGKVPTSVGETLRERLKNRT